MDQNASLDRKRKTKNPCPVCFLNETRCLCAHIPKLTLRTQLALVIHRKELKRTTNTGRLALAALTNSEMFVRGEAGKELEFEKILSDDYHPLLFFPADDAAELTREFVSKIEKPIRLIVPDGNWRQASKIHYRHREFDGVTRVKFSDPNLATQHLRAETSPEGMSTLEAIAKAYGIIEGDEVGNQLLALYREKLERTLLGRGTYLVKP
ncbi:MAG: DTW domain-containing protein [Proteobacteria bacterium]|nr:MAG: DTW domain-containing protein [Pseudomonadota bacterium]